jgi:hypothetical protein
MVAALAALAEAKDALRRTVLARPRCLTTAQARAGESRLSQPPGNGPRFEQGGWLVISSWPGVVETDRALRKCSSPD